MSDCPHDTTVPVEVVQPDADPTHAPVIEVVARLCLDCDDQLPANWGCGDCEWAEERSFCDRYPRRHLTVPCPTHRGA